MHASIDFPIVIPLRLDSKFILAAFIRPQEGLNLLHHGEHNLLSPVVNQLHRKHRLHAIYHFQVGSHYHSH